MFSIFAPEAFGNLPINWISTFIVCLMITPNFWYSYTAHSIRMAKILLVLNHELKSVAGVWYQPGNNFLFLGLFVFIFSNNFWGLSPYIFTSSSHLTFTFWMGFSLWLGSILKSFSSDFEFSMSHLIPAGTPPLLMPFMVIIELISLLIRPLTLAVRLAANMIAGHLLISLLSSAAVNQSLLILTGVMSALLILILLELAVSIIQAYVYMLLSCIYSYGLMTKKNCV